MKKLDLLFQVIRQPEIIAIEKGYVLSARRAQTGVTRCGCPTVFLPEINDTLSVGNQGLLKSSVSGEPSLITITS
ncbi:MAG: hypothetical protein WKF84_16810 [Pyrinomonadaceae bacterium]